MLKEKEYYIEHGKANIALKTDIEKTADLVCAEGFSNIFFAGSGGSICMLAPFVEILKKRTDIVAYAEEAADCLLPITNSFQRNPWLLLYQKPEMQKNLWN